MEVERCRVEYAFSNGASLPRSLLSAVLRSAAADRGRGGFLGRGSCGSAVAVTAPSGGDRIVASQRQAPSTADPNATSEHDATLVQGRELDELLAASAKRQSLNPHDYSGFLAHDGSWPR